MFFMQSTATKQEFQGSDMPVDMQRCNSAPDLRVLIEGQINPPPPTNRLPPLGSETMMGAIVPFKAPKVDSTREWLSYEFDSCNDHGSGVIFSHLVVKGCGLKQL